jgi:hypothetical protein
MIYYKNKQNKLKDIAFALHPYFDSLSLRNTSKALSWFVKRSHMTIRDRFKNTNYKILSYHQNKIAGYVIDEILIKVGSSEFI